MNITNIGIGMLLTSIIFHICIALGMAIYYYNFDTDAIVVNENCKVAAFANNNPNLCESPHWLESTPLKDIVTAWPEGESLTLRGFVGLLQPFMLAIVKLLYANYEIFYDVDPVIEVVITIIRIASIIASFLLVISVAQGIWNVLRGLL